MNKKEIILKLTAGLGATITPNSLEDLLSKKKTEASTAPIFTEPDDQLLRKLSHVLLPKSTISDTTNIDSQSHVNSYIRDVIPEQDQKTLYKNYSSWKAQFTMRHRMSAEKASLATLTEEVSQRFNISEETQKKVLSKDLSIGQENLNCYAFLLSFFKLTLIGYYSSEERSEECLSSPPISEPIKQEVLAMIGL